MHSSHHGICRLSDRPPISRQRLALLAALVLCTLGSGCAALTNPVADGVPVRRLPPEVFPPPREEEQTIPLSLLRQKPPETYRLGPGDVLGVWIEGILGDGKQAPPVHYPEQGNLPPAFGYPFPVREDGTVPLPLVTPVAVKGMTLEEAQQAIREAYVVKPGRERIIVTLLRRRLYHILVIRQDSVTQGSTPPTSPGTRSVGFTLGSAGAASSLRRGQGFAIDLPAYENDVLNALALTGGLPGLDAVNEVVIQRGSFGSDQDRATRLQQPEALRAAGKEGQVIRIPLRQRQGETPSFRPEDVILQTGDLVFIEARPAEFFYTGGLLPPGEYLLPRDYDLDVLEAIVRVGGPVASGGINPINITGSFLAGGIGFPSPSLVTVLRQAGRGRQLPIRVDLNRALRDPRERILLQPGDVVLLQETSGEALTRYFTQTFSFNVFARVIRGRDVTGNASLTVP